MLWEHAKVGDARAALFFAVAFDLDQRDRLILVNARAWSAASSCKTVKATRTSRQIVKYFLADLRPLKSRKAEEAVADRVRIIKHEAVPKCSSYEVRFSDGRPSKYFYWEDISGRHVRSDRLDSQRALEEAKAFARAERDRA